MEEIKFIKINKNRGWRGLAELCCTNKDRDRVTSNVFSFSQAVWDDMQCGQVVLQDKDNYYVLHFDGADELPKGQRSVLIKNFEGTVTKVNKYNKNTWMKDAKDARDYTCIYDFIKNRNNHTTSDWNCIGIRVVPMI